MICSLFAAALAGQIAVPALGSERALAAGCLVMIAGTGLLAASLAESSLALLTAGAMIAGAGQGLSFRSGLALVRTLSPPQQAGRIASTFFVVLYAAVSTAVIGIGVATQNFGLRPTGIATAAIVAVLAAICTGSLSALRQQPLALKHGGRSHSAHQKRVFSARAAQKPDDTRSAPDSAGRM